MTGIEVVPFSFEGKEYQIRVVSDGATIYVRAFCDNKPANGYSYQVTIMTAFDLKKLMGFDAIKQLIKSAREDVEQKRWERFLEAIKT
jgi:hypothetical protein